MGVRRNFYFCLSTHRNREITRAPCCALFECASNSKLRRQTLARSATRVATGKCTRSFRCIRGVRPQPCSRPNRVETSDVSALSVTRIVHVRYVETFRCKYTRNNSVSRPAAVTFGVGTNYFTAVQSARSRSRACTAIPRTTRDDA